MSDRINCGVYIFTPDIFTAIQGVSTQRKDRGMYCLVLLCIIATIADILRAYLSVKLSLTRVDIFIDRRVPLLSINLVGVVDLSRLVSSVTCKTSVLN